MSEPLPMLWEIDLAHVESAVLRRLIAELREARAGEQDDAVHDGPLAYDRIHNRYNRQSGHPYDRVHNRHNRGR